MRRHTLSISALGEPTITLLQAGTKRICHEYTMEPHEDQNHQEASGVSSADGLQCDMVNLTTKALLCLLRGTKQAQNVQVTPAVLQRGGFPKHLQWTVRLLLCLALATRLKAHWAEVCHCLLAASIRQYADTARNEACRWKCKIKKAPRVLPCVASSWCDACRGSNYKQDVFACELDWIDAVRFSQFSDTLHQVNMQLSVSPCVGLTVFNNRCWQKQGKNKEALKLHRHFSAQLFSSVRVNEWIVRLSNWRFQIFLGLH